MKKSRNIEALWAELSSLADINERRSVIHQDTRLDAPRYLVLAEDDPYRLFNLLGGDASEIETMNWAFEYTYEECIEENDIEYDSEEEKNWDLEKKSIERAHNTGHWYVTGTSIVKGPNGIELEFEFEFCEGYLGIIIGTPYNREEHGHGIGFN